MLQKITLQCLTCSVQSFKTSSPLFGWILDQYWICLFHERFLSKTRGPSLTGSVQSAFHCLFRQDFTACSGRRVELEGFIAQLHQHLVDLLAQLGQTWERQELWKAARRVKCNLLLILIRDKGVIGTVKIGETMKLFEIASECPDTSTHS